MSERKVQFLQFRNCYSGETCPPIDVSRESQHNVERIERGMLINCNVEGGWFVDWLFEQPKASAK